MIITDKRCPQVPGPTTLSIKHEQAFTYKGDVYIKVRQATADSIPAVCRSTGSGYAIYALRVRDCAICQLDNVEVTPVKMEVIIS